MRKSFTAVLFSLFVLAGVSLTTSAIDKKDDKNGGKKGHPPVIIIVWEPAWSPVTRVASPESMVSTFDVVSESNVGAL